jgi:pilus assembly protein FimV
MQRLLGLTLLTLSLAVPTASLALGLGDIHVESALHQPLVAQIELVGATNDELGRLSAAIASDEIFERYNLERAPFIYGTTLVVGQDRQGHPVLNVRSTEKFTEPVVTLLVDLHASNGELIREYTIFLDPPGIASKPSGVESTSATSPTPVSSRTAGASPAALSSRAAGASPAAVTAAAAAQAVTTVGAPERAMAGPDTNASAGTNAVADSKLLGHTYTVARRDTLDHIVSAAGAHSRIDRHRMMIAIFRANPAAFQNNFNKLHTGVTLHFPSAEQLAAISAEEVSREYDAQMAAWRVPGHRVAPAAPQPISTTPALPGDSANTNTAAANSGTRDSASTDSSASSAGAASASTASAGASSAGAASAGTASAGAASASAASASTASAGATSASAALARAASGAAHAGVGNRDVGADSKPGADSQETDRAVLTKRVASLEKSLDQLKQELKQPLVVQKAAPVAAAAAPAPEPEATADEDEDEPRPAPHHKLLLLASLFVAIGVVLVLILAAGAWFYRRRRNAANHPAMAPARMKVTDDQPVEFSKEFSKALPPPLSQTALGAALPVEKAPSEPLQSSAKVPSNTASWFEESFSTPIAELLANDPMAGSAHDTTAELAVEATAKLPAAQLEDPGTTVMLAPDFDVVGDTVEQKFSFFNPESANNTEHVVMSSGLNEPKPFVERRKNPADVLRQAIEREPDRSDLRLKLLELYYTAAAENRRAFLDATRQLAKNEKLASPEDWSRIADMGRTIAPDDKLFADELDDKRVA